MKSASGPLNTHLQQEVTTLATCWRMTRLDGVKFHFTEHDQSLPISIDATGEATYKATSSYNRSAFKNNDGLSVDNLDLTGVLTAGDVEETELRRGLFDYALTEIFLVNWDDLSQGILKMRRGRIGEVTITANGFFVAELRGLTQAYSRRIGELYSPECRTDLGDDRCKIPIDPEVAVRNKSYAVGDFVRAASELETVPESVFLTHYDGDADDIALSAVASLGTQAALQTVEKQFGTGAMEFSPSGSVDPSQATVNYPDRSEYTIGASEFTIECWVRFKDLTDAIQCLMSQYTTSGNERAWFIQRNAGDLSFQVSPDGTIGAATTVNGAFTFVIDTWYHIAITRDSSDDLRMFVDGTQVGSTTALAVTIHNSTSPLRIGKLRNNTLDDNPLFGFIDDPRIVIGVALYTSGFTKPAAEFQLISEVVAGLLCPSFDDRVYVATTAGISDAGIQPAYDTTIGNTTTDGTVVFTAEDAWSRCITVDSVDGTDPRKIFTVTELTPNSGGITDGRDSFADDSMNGGVVIWETGVNTGVAMEIRDFTADDGVTIEQDIELFLDLPFDIAVGDTARVYRGCFHRFLTDCRDIFDNVVNFRGEPYVPGQDAIVNYPDAKA